MKVSEVILAELELGNNDVALIAEKLGTSTTAIKGALMSLKKQGHSLTIVDGKLVQQNKPVIIERTDEHAGVEYTTIATIMETIEPVESMEHEQNMAYDVADNVTIEMSGKSKRGRKTDPNSPRQRAFVIVREMMAAGERRKDIKSRLISELGIKEGNAGIYIQQVRGQMGLVKHTPREDTTNATQDVV